MGLFDLFGSSRTATASRIEPTLSPVASLENPSVNLSGAEGTWLYDWATAGNAATFGPAINERTAMAVSAVHRCVTLISGMIANLPMKVYERTPEGRRDASDNRVAGLLKMAPHPRLPMTAHSFKEMLVQGILCHGNGYAVIRYDQAARVIGLEWAAPWTVEVLRTGAGRQVYRITWPHDPVEYVDYTDMIHVAGPGFDGISGVSRIQFAARDSIALAKVLEQQAGVVHENAARPSGVVEVPANIGAEAFKRMREQFASTNGGRSNAGKTYFADAGSKFTPIQMTMEDLSTLAFRQFQVADISRFFGVPLPLLNEVSGSTSWGTGLAEQNLAFLAYTLDADLSRIENVFNARLFADGRYYVEFERDALLAMDPLKSAQVAQTEVSFGGLTPNEYRRIKNRPSVEGGDAALVNSTNIPLTRAINPPEPMAPAAPPQGNADA